MATLIVNGHDRFGALPDLSPFVSKVEAYLRLAGLDYEFRPGDMLRAPRGKMPYLVHGDRTITDSALIIAYLREQGLADLDASLDAAQRAELAAVSSMLELEQYFILSYFRYQTPAGWATYLPYIRAALRNLGVPGPFVGAGQRMVLSKTLKQLKAHGVGRREYDENLARAREIFDSLEHFVSRREGPWWFGAEPTSLDAIGHAFVSGSITTNVDTPMHGLLEGRPRLAAWYGHAHSVICG